MSFLLSAEAAAPNLRDPRAAPVTKGALDAHLVDALRDGRPLPPLADTEVEVLLERIIYHGVAGLLASGDRLKRWPPSLADRVVSIARAQAMWELRHASILRPLLQGFADAGVSTLLLKGSALAYDLYDDPAQRTRADSDLLVHEKNVPRARSLLQAAGFTAPIDGAFLPPSLRSQESWLLRSGDGLEHWIDLHWRPLNSPALDRIFSVEDWFARARPLPRLSDAAFAAERPRMLLHACLHRSMHDCAPYMVGGATHFGGNRFVWLWDIVLLGRAMTQREWRRFCQLARDHRVADACSAGLAAAADHFGPIGPLWVEEQLISSRPSLYFSGGQLRRAWLDWLAVPGLGRKVQYLRARILPDGDFMRGKYPELHRRPLAVLYARRVLDLLRRRP